MLNKLKPGTQVKIAFSKAQIFECPNYCAAWEGKTGVVVKSDPVTFRQGFMRVQVGEHTLCLERENVTEKL